MKLIAGLGNPGSRFKGTRHNVGFEVIDTLAERWRLLEFDEFRNALTVKWQPIGGDSVLLLKPMSFMNLSGQPIGDVARYYKVEASDVLVILDEIQLPLGKLRARARGSAGGHNGLKSVVEHLGSDIARLRMGVGRGDSRRDLADHVLAKFDKDEADEVARMTTRAADAAEAFITGGIADVMNRFNGGDPATTE